ncbi:MAG: hypothetical protein UW41_C0005G0022 [Candidatus Collierbacteria bacterium GW2011_GWC2_44_18]|uniref:Mannosyltransferase B-like protein n=2 Tax=Microgenomates group TaxID=1794810 RepID=A0A0G1LGD1_9BACT|nr:MAG: mannosyltransferase B-like protein [Microgenomates group bacterium GW2011_GWC1_44_10]KKT49519.1 MAG: hypothetical protein UW41_C0005G0022 [Candidatus Collierbacteria bacterium GW2011_GWC2_44_18]KKT67757.1 MAG: hypothetical protein UW60_C0001G0035 [Candidatus Woesebacteria bacterium GW2011_GWA2_44_33]
MRIGIDARLYGLEHAGLGRYVTEMVNEVLRTDTKNDYVLFLDSSHAKEFQNRKRVKVIVTQIPIYGFLEQIVLPLIFTREKLDLLHIPHFNAPLFYPGKFILTIHDLIKHESKGKETTTRQPWIYFIKRLGYIFLTHNIVRRATHIIVPSEFVRQDVSQKLHVKTEKISITYEAVSSRITKVRLTESEKNKILFRYGLSQPFVVYTGSTYPHKNVELLINAIIKHNETKEVDLQLALIGARPVFWERMQKKILDKGVGHWVKQLGFLADEDVSKIYSLALALVHPSKMEGFGLTGMEAMNVGLPVISSNASCLPEVYGEAALFFDPDSVEDLVEKMETLISDIDLREKLSNVGPLQAKKYSWARMGRETVAIYNKFLK